MTFKNRNFPFQKVENKFILIKKAHMTTRKERKKLLWMPLVIYCWDLPSYCFRLFVLTIQRRSSGNEKKRSSCEGRKRKLAEKMFAFFLITKSSFSPRMKYCPSYLRRWAMMKELEEEVQTHMRASDEIPLKKNTQKCFSYKSIKASGCRKRFDICQKGYEE